MCVGVGCVWVLGMCGCALWECVGVVCENVWVWYVGMCGCGTVCGNVWVWNVGMCAGGVKYCAVCVCGMCEFSGVLCTVCSLCVRYVCVQWCIVQMVCVVCVGAVGYCAAGVCGVCGCSGVLCTVCNWCVWYVWVQWCIVHCVQLVCVVYVWVQWCIVQLLCVVGICVLVYCSLCVVCGVLCYVRCG